MYMTVDEIRLRSKRISAIQDATDEDLEFWVEEALDEIHAHCLQDFAFEPQVTKSARVATTTIVTLPKVLSGDVTVKSVTHGILYDSHRISNKLPTGGSVSEVYLSPNYLSQFTPTGPVELFPGSFHLGYYVNNKIDRSHRTDILTITGDWGFARTPEELLILSVNSFRALYEQHRINDLAHTFADTTNAITVPAATTLDEAVTLLNDILTQLSAHVLDDTLHLEASDAIELDEATDLDSAIELIGNLKTVFGAHVLSETAHAEKDTDSSPKFSTDFAYGVMPTPIRRAFLRLVQRIAIRDNSEDIRQANMPYSHESLGDDYSYSLDNPTLRNLLRPAEMKMLAPYVNRGKVVV